MNNYTGQTVAVDASVLLYQFMSSIVTSDGTPLTNAAGNVTSHLVGLLSRVAKITEAGIRPVFVFDGKPPEDKQGELAHRREQRQKALDALEKARDAGDTDEARRLAKRTIKVTPEQSAQAITMLTLLGVACVQAEGEAEAQCVSMARAGQVNAVASSDLDCLALGCPVMLRDLGRTKDEEVTELNLKAALEETGLELAEFVDLCIMCGCDYCSSLEGVGPKTAYQLIQKHRSIERILQNEPKVAAKAVDWPYQRARELFREPPAKAVPEASLQPPPLKAEECISWLVGQMQFAEENATRMVTKIAKARTKPKQLGIESFLKVTASPRMKPDKGLPGKKGGQKRQRK